MLGRGLADERELGTVQLDGGIEVGGVGALLAGVVEAGSVGHREPEGVAAEVRLAEGEEVHAGRAGAPDPGGHALGARTGSAPGRMGLCCRDAHGLGSSQSERDVVDEPRRPEDGPPARGAPGPRPARAPEGCRASAQETYSTCASGSVARTSSMRPRSDVAIALAGRPGVAGGRRARARARARRAAPRARDGRCATTGPGRRPRERWGRGRLGSAARGRRPCASMTMTCWASFWPK